ncbi:MAG: hypothetical protein KAT16_05255 [Candidatus Heimdallarchaeota archaeon]|nr:hypothetical protein [Candidatus Heimdallarchaeota archaeon]
MGVNKCGQCYSTNIFFDCIRSEIICENCGLVLSDRIVSEKPDWRAYDSKEHKLKSRVGQPATRLNNHTLHTVIERNGLDALGNHISITRQKKYLRLSRINNRTREKQKRNLEGPINELKRIKSHLNLPNDIGETAIYYYEMALTRDLIKGRSVPVMIGAAIYIACRKKKYALTMKDLISIVGVSYKKLGRAIRIYLQYLNINSIDHDYTGHVYRLGASLELTMYTQSVAIEVLKEAQKRSLTVGKAPMSIAAAAIYIATVKTGEKRTQAEVAKAAQTTPVTVRNRFKELKKGLGINDLVIKRGAGAKSVIIDDPVPWVYNSLSVKIRG